MVIAQERVESAGVSDVLDDLFEGACLVGGDLTLLRWNSALEVLTGYHSAEVVGRRCPDSLLLGIDRAQAALHGLTGQLADALSDGCNREFEAYLRHKDGHCLPARVRVAVVPAALGGTRAAVLILGRVARRDLRPHPEQTEVQDTSPDLLTGLPDRWLVEKHLRASLSEMYRHGWSFGIVLLGVRGLCELARRHGQAAADRALRAVATTLANVTAPGDIAGRWGHDSFLSVCRDTTSREIEALAVDLRSLVAAVTWPPPRRGARLRAVAGATMAVPGHTCESLLRRVAESIADDARPGA